MFEEPQFLLLLGPPPSCFFVAEVTVAEVQDFVGDLRSGDFRSGDYRSIAFRSVAFRSVGDPDLLFCGVGEYSPILGGRCG